VGDLPDSCGAPQSATSPQLGRGKLLAIVIIPNMAGMFNIIRTFLGKFFATKRHKIYKKVRIRRTSLATRRSLVEAGTACAIYVLKKHFFWIDGLEDLG